MPESPVPTDVRSRILQEALHLFAARGYDGVPIEEIARAAGVTRPTLVYHFGSKAELREKVLEALLGRWRDELPALLQAATTGSDRFRSTFDALAGFFCADPARARLLLREMLDRPDEMAALFRLHLQPWTELVIDYVRRGQEEGRIRAALDPEAYAVQILNAMIVTAGNGHRTSEILRDPPDEARQLAELRRIARTRLFNDRPPEGG
ncbi:MAG: helix-turn-helix domain-containing protein [Myxococcota bacterium]